jgi:hypothetical protein
MNTRITIEVEGNETNIMSQLAAVAAKLTAGVTTQAETATPVKTANAQAKATAPTTETPKTVKKAKARKPEDVTTLDEDTDEELDFGSDEEETEETEAEAEEELTEEKVLALTDVISAFQTYAKKNSREKAAKVLTKFNAKSVRDLKPNQYGSVMNALQ